MLAVFDAVVFSTYVGAQDAKLIKLPVDTVILSLHARTMVCVTPVVCGGSRSGGRWDGGVGDEAADHQGEIHAGRDPQHEEEGHHHPRTAHHRRLNLPGNQTTLQHE